MKIKAYLYVDIYKNIRLKKTHTKPSPSEIVIELSVNIPEEFFKRPMPVVNIDIPKDFLIDPDFESVSHFAALEIADKLKLDLKLVEDGLLNLFKQKQLTNGEADE